MNTITTIMGSYRLRKASLLLSLVLLGYAPILAQDKVRIREVQTVNRHGVQDEYGHNSAWIELNNTTAATTNIAGMYLTDDPSNPTKFPIRAGSIETSIAPHQNVVLFLDGESDKGIFHSGLKLDPTKTNTIYLYQGDGENLVDSVTVPVLQDDQSYAYLVNDEASGEGSFQIVDNPTPYSPNSYVHGNRSVENFKGQDPIGLVMTLIAMGVVFTALILLFFVFGSIGKRFVKRDSKQEKDKNGKQQSGQIQSKPLMNNQKKSPITKGETPVGVQVAIAMALHEYQDNGVHAAISLALFEAQSGRNEQTGMIKLKNDATHSAWANKAFTMRRLPNF